MQHECMTAVLTGMYISVIASARRLNFSADHTCSLSARYTFVRDVCCCFDSGTWTWCVTLLCECMREWIACWACVSVSMCTCALCVSVSACMTISKMSVSPHSPVCIGVTTNEHSTHSSTCCHLNEQYTTHDMLTHGFADTHTHTHSHIYTHAGTHTLTYLQPLNQNERQRQENQRHTELNAIIFYDIDWKLFASDNIHGTYE